MWPHVNCFGGLSELSRQFVNVAYRSQFRSSNIQLDEITKLVIKLLSDTLYFCVLCGSSTRLKDCLTLAGCVTSITLADKYVYAAGRERIVHGNCNLQIIKSWTKKCRETFVLA